MNDKNKDFYRKKIGHFTIRGGFATNGEPSLILGMPSAHQKDVYVALKIDGITKLSAITTCISTLLKEYSSNCFKKEDKNDETNT